MSSIWQRLTGGTKSSTGSDSGQGPDEVRLWPAVPGVVDGHQLAMGTTAQGPYRFHDGQEAYGPATTLTSIDDGSKQEVGVGCEVATGDTKWIAVAFEEDGALVLRRREIVDLGGLVFEDDNPPVYPDADMCNLWVQTEGPYVTWIADLGTTVRQDPARLSSFVEAVIAAGEQTGAMRILQARSLQYFREEHGELIPFLRQRWSAQGGPELFGDMDGLEVDSSVAWFDDSGRLFECPTSRLERILEMDEPNDWILDGFKEPWPPIRIFGATAEDIREAQAGDWDIPIRLQISLHSDIWFPWVHALCHPLHTRGRQFDNRVLAERHTPRLNAFLEAVGAAAEAAGGTFGLDPDQCGVAPHTVTDRGIVLDVPVPENPMTLEEYSAPWP